MFYLGYPLGDVFGSIGLVFGAFLASGLFHKYVCHSNDLMCSSLMGFVLAASFSGGQLRKVLHGRPLHGFLPNHLHCLRKEFSIALRVNEFQVHGAGYGSGRGS